ncbi:hypothetical protein [Tetragenococcus solitarius]|uniref:YlbF family regulator n=1 Tax=Tetragenococcus solitarius TaxID=71453 RepID=A0ABN3Y691_9ENTE|nr:hypothetical protein [Tetragenococcus solitarius]
MNENYEALEATMEELKAENLSDNEIYGLLGDIEDFTHNIKMDLEPTEKRFIKDKNKTTVDRNDLENMLKNYEKLLNAYEELAKQTDELISGIQEELISDAKADMKPFLYVLKGDNHNEK